jgi:hypothetical protein
MRKPVGVTTRFFVMKRDGFKCVVCGRSPATTIGLQLEVDHIQPISKGGTNNTDNLRTTCYDCNRGKRDHVLHQVNTTNNIFQESSIKKMSPRLPPRMEAKKMSSVENKNPILISADVFRMLDPFHRAAAEVLQEHGECIIEGQKVSP